MADVVLLWVDPDPNGLPERLAADPAVRVHRRDSVESAGAALEEYPIDCVVTAFDLPDGTGTDLVARVRERRPDAGCLLRTDADPERIASADGGSLVYEYVDDRASDAHERIERLVRTTAQRRSQATYPLPADEDERLAALERYDFAAPALEAPLQRITDLAARHFEVAQSSVNVVREHRQSFLACHADRWAETAREDSICTYSILASGVTVVEDTREDPRFAANEVLAELGVRFYAGATVRVAEDLPIGAVCVYDEHPRSFAAEDEAYLQLLADEAADWIEVASRARREPEDRESTDEGPDRDSTDEGSDRDSTDRDGPAEDARQRDRPDDDRPARSAGAGSRGPGGGER